MNYLVSVILPTYNREKTLLRSIYSVLNQSYQNLELLIIDDGSNDQTEKLVGSIRDNRIIYIKYSKNRGACAARNIGIAHARGNYIAFQDSDDEWLPQKLDLQIKLLNTTNSDIVFCSFFKHHKEKVILIKPKFNVSKTNIYNQLLMGNFISTQTLLCKKKVF